MKQQPKITEPSNIIASHITHRNNLRIFSDVSYLSSPYIEHQLLSNGYKDDFDDFLISRREGSFEGDVYETAEDVEGRIRNVLQSIRKTINPTIKSIEGDIFKLNRDRVIIAIANWLASKAAQIIHLTDYLC